LITEARDVCSMVNPGQSKHSTINNVPLIQPETFYTNIMQKEPMRM
jgi:hypothetical protein